METVNIYKGNKVTSLGYKDLDFHMYDFLPFPIIVFGSSDELVYYNQSADDSIQISRFTDEEIVKFRTSLYRRYKQPATKATGGFYYVKTNGKELLFTINIISFGKSINYKLVFFRTGEMIANAELELYNVKRELAIIQKMIDSSYDGIYLTDGEGKTLYFNDSFVRISGFKREEAYGRKLQDLLKENYLPNSCSTEVVKLRQPYTTMINYYSGVDAIVTGMPIFDEDGNLIRVFSNVRDISELNRLKEELENVYALSNGYKQQLREFQRHCLTRAKIIAESKPMANIIDLVMKAAFADSPIMITGESGVGKDEIAKFIHNVSEASKKGTFIRINCGAIPEHLLESELFGYEPHAFTGANNKGKVGLFQLAEGGTLFLNEIGDMPLSLQAKLLDAIQEKAVFRVGGTKPIKFNARIIAATNKDLEVLIKEKKFRLDLYYRLNVIPIHIPPLRERTEDILPLINLFLDECNEKYGQNKKFSPDALSLMIKYKWPGNIRELKNIIERLVVTNNSNEISADDLSSDIKISFNYKKREDDELFWSQIDEGKNLKQVVEIIEQRMIENALEKEGTVRKAAKLLCIDPSTLVRKKKRYFQD